MRRLICIVFCALMCSQIYAWDERGHSAVACLADRNLKPSVKKQVEQYLGKEIPFYSSWMDEWREDPAYAFSSSCHMYRVDEQYRYRQKENTMDAVTLLESAIEVVKDRKNQTDSAVVVNLKFIIHLVGDIHCPSHMMYAFKGTNFDVYPYKGETKKCSYHHVWDGEVIERRCQLLGPEELARNFDRKTKAEIKEIQSGSVRDWVFDCGTYCRQIYDMAHKDEVVYKPFYNAAWPIVERQITYAGYRLAKVLNDCFAK